MGKREGEGKKRGNKEWSSPLFTTKNHFPRASGTSYRYTYSHSVKICPLLGDPTVGIAFHFTNLDVVHA